jgi:hypothetical protein
VSIDRLIDVLFVDPERFRAKPQIGVPCTMTFDELAFYLAKPSVGDAKDCAGAWSCALYTENIRRKANLVHVHAIVVDVDENGDVDEVAVLFGRYRSLVLESFTSTDDAPRCRALALLAEPITVAEYEEAHRIVRAHLRTQGVVADEGAKDASRLSYAPVRRAGARYRFRLNEGEPLDARAMLRAQPAPAPRVVVPPPAPEHADRYVRGALQRAANAVGSSSPGERHYALSREAFTLARLDVPTSEIESALLPAFVAAAGDTRMAEGVRTIRDAVRARRGAT